MPHTLDTFNVVPAQAGTQEDPPVRVALNPRFRGEDISQNGDSRMSVIARSVSDEAIHLTRSIHYDWIASLRPQ